MVPVGPDEGDFLGLSRTTKNPQGLTPRGFSGLLRPYRTFIWWPLGDLNPRPIDYERGKNAFYCIYVQYAMLYKSMPYGA